MSQQRYKSTTVAVWVLACLAVSPLTAGVVYEVEVTSHEASQTTTEMIETQVEGLNLKMGIASKGSGTAGEMIFRGDRREMVVVDNDQQTYMVIDEATIDRVAGQLNSVMAQMEEALKNVPEDRRAMVEQMMKQRMPAAAEVATDEGSGSVLERTGERADKNGYPCVKYVVSRDGKKLRELWVTDWSNVDEDGEAAEVFEEMADFFRQLMEAIPKMGPGGAPLDDNFFEHMKELGGFPVVTLEFDDEGGLESQAALRSARRMTLDPDAFEPPSGYKRQTMMLPGQ